MNLLQSRPIGDSRDIGQRVSMESHAWAFTGAFAELRDLSSTPAAGNESVSGITGTCSPSFPNTSKCCGKDGKRFGTVSSRSRCKLVQRAFGRQMRLFDQPSRPSRMQGISCLVFPIPAHAFFKQAVLQGEIGHDLLQGGGPRRRSFTSPDVAARAVSPANRRLPASRNSLDQP